PEILVALAGERPFREPRSASRQRKFDGLCLAKEPEARERQRPRLPRYAGRIECGGGFIGEEPGCKEPLFARGMPGLLQDAAHFRELARYQHVERLREKQPFVCCGI